MQKADPRKIFCLLLAGFLFFAASSFAAEAENGEIQIRKVRFVGLKMIKKKAVTANLVVQIPPVWKFWESGSTATRQEIEEDTLRIKQYYQSQGYYQASVTHSLTPVGPETSPPTGPIPDASPDPTKDRSPEQVTLGKIDASPVPVYDVTFHIEEGLPVMVRGITIHGLPETTTINDATLKAGMPLKAGRRFISEDYEQAKILTRKALGNQGYPFAKVAGRAVVDLNDNRADITFDIAHGERYLFGDIRVSGHEDFVRETVIRRAVSIVRGDQYSAQAMDDSRANLFDLTIFKTAVIKAGEPDKENHTLPIDITVKPRKKQSVKFGVGYGTDDGLRLQGAWSYRNLTGHADRLSFRARRSDITENIYGEYLFPYFLSARNDLGTTAGYEREQRDYYTLNRTVSETFLYHKLRPNWLVSTGYKLEANRPENIEATDSDTVIDPRDTENFLVSSAIFSVARNTVDDVLHSTKGSVITFSIENASGYLGSETDYLRPGLEAKGFVPLPWEMVLAGRADFQSIQKAENTDYIPISKQFFMGGSKSVRGYGYEKMGVIDENDAVVDISGLSSFMANLELRFPVYEDLGGVVFLDSGVLSRDSFRADLGNLRYAAGVGLRYYTIIGPVQLDFGYKLNPAKRAVSDDPLLVSLANKDRWYLHFNIGQTF